MACAGHSHELTLRHPANHLLGDFCGEDRAVLPAQQQRRGADGFEEQTISDRDVYITALLPGFELPLGKLLAVCDAWKKKPLKD